MAITDVTIRTRRWSRREYDRLVELGVLDEDEPIEPLDGHLGVKEPQYTHVLNRGPAGVRSPADRMFLS